MECPLCGRAIEASDRACQCSPKAYVLDAESGSYEVTGHPSGLVSEGSPESPDGRSVDSRPLSGGRSYSSTDQEGGFTAELSGSLDRGRPNEAHALKVLIQALRARGEDVTLSTGGRDDHGEDALLSLNGRCVQVQIVSVPVDQSLWKELSSRGLAHRTGTDSDAVKMVREALMHKKHKATGTLLVLDAAHLGAIVGPSLVDAYNDKYGDPEDEFSLLQAWILGQTARSAFRLGLNTP